MHPQVDELLERSWSGRRRAIRGAELRTEVVVTGAFAAAAVALPLLAPPAYAPDPVTVALVLALALAARVEFPIGAAYFTPTQLFLVPLFVLAPAQLVPALVFAAFLLAATAASATGAKGFDRVAFCAGDSVHALGPAIVLTIFAGGDATDAAPWVLVCAFGGQLLADFLSSSVHEIAAMGSRARVHLRLLTEVWSVDVALTAIGLLAAWAATSEPWAALAPLPLVLLLGALAADRVRSVDAAVERLRALERERGRRQAAGQLLQRQNGFLQDVTHELRTPATIARGYIETLERAHGASPESGVALDELGRIERIVERLLAIARADQPTSLAREPLDAEALLEDRFVRWSDTTPRPWCLGRLAAGTLTADGDALRAALDALIENAVEHTSATQAITLSSEVVGDALVICVADEGAGIPADAIDRIFERFARADSARSRRTGGAGLGLAMVSAVARAHGGDCTVSSSPAGSTFRLRLAGFSSAPHARMTSSSSARI